MVLGQYIDLDQEVVVRNEEAIMADMPLFCSIKSAKSPPTKSEQVSTRSAKTSPTKYEQVSTVGNDL
jgi:hypothetical protein